MGRLATSTLSANQGLQRQLKLLSHPGIDVFMGRRRKTEGPYYAGMSSAESSQQVHFASQRSSESETGSDTGSRRASVENSFASGYLNTDVFCQDPWIPGSLDPLDPATFEIQI